MTIRHALIFGLLLSSLTILTPIRVRAQEETTDKSDTEAATADKPAEDAPAATPAEEWKTLSARRNAIIASIRKLRKEFVSADRERKLAIRDEFNELVAEFNTKLVSRMTELAPQILTDSPNDVPANEFVMQQAYDENRYEEAFRIASKLIVLEQATAHTRNLAGVAAFALHRFDEASQILKKADEDGVLDQTLGGRYLASSEEYIDLWKTEQETIAAEAMADEDSLNPQVEITTSRGKIVVELFENEAPNTVANFVELIEGGAYDGTKFHRVLPSFVIQGGDPNSRDDDPSNDGFGGPGHSIKCECYDENARMHFAGSLSMAHSGRDTGGSQFFITHLPTPHLNGKHTVFGRVVEGMEVVAAVQKGDALEKASVLRKRPHEYKAETTADASPEPKDDDSDSKDEGSDDSADNE